MNINGRQKLLLLCEKKGVDVTLLVSLYRFNSQALSSSEYEC